MSAPQAERIPDDGASPVTVPELATAIADAARRREGRQEAAARAHMSAWYRDHPDRPYPG